MKRRISAILLASVVICSMVFMAACGNKSDEKSTEKKAGTEKTIDKTTDKGKKRSYKIGVAVQTLSNQVWAQQMDAIQKEGKADGNDVTVVECKENANTQIDQLENFITSKCDIIIVNPVDPDAIEDVCKKARAAGIIVVSWDEEMKNSDFNWVIKNYDLGSAIGEQAAKFINKKFGDKGCEVVVLGYPQTPILLEREKGILAQLKKLAPNAKVVANQPAIDTTEGLNAMETILQAHPKVKVVCCIGGGGATGANEALKGVYGSKVPDDVGIFSTDLTDETIASIENGEFNRVCIAITGNAYVCGKEIYNLATSYADGKKLEHNVYRKLIPVNKDNIEEMVNQK